MKLILLIPSIESHFSNFLPILLHSNSSAIDFKLLMIDDVIHNNRQFVIPDIISDKVMYFKTSHLAFYYFAKTKQIDCLSVVGNDSEPNISYLLRKFKSIGIKRILLQDGWLVSNNILRPIYAKKNTVLKLKKKLHGLLVSKYSPFKSFFHNFIGQNSDYYFVYSEVSKNEFIKAGISCDQIVITGSPRFASLRNFRKGIKKAVVFFSTDVPNEDDYIISLKRIVASVGNFIRYEFGQDIMYIIKPHPRSPLRSIYSYDSNTNVYTSNISSLFDDYDVIFSFCFDSTVILELIILDIPFIQLMIYPFSNNTNFQKSLPYIVSLDDMHNKYISINKPDIISYGKKLLLDIDPNVSSTQLIIDALTVI